MEENQTVKVIMPEGVTSVSVGDQGETVEANSEGHFEMELKHALHMVEAFGARIFQKIMPRRPSTPPVDPPVLTAADEAAAKEAAALAEKEAADKAAAEAAAQGGAT